MNIEMVPLQIVGLKTDLKAIVQTLRRLGCVQIDPLDEATGISARKLTLDSEILHIQEEVSFLLARVEGLLDTLGEGAPHKGLLEMEDYLAEARESVDFLTPKIQSLVARREKLQSEIAALPRYEATLRKLLPIIPPSAREHYGFQDERYSTDIPQPARKKGLFPAISARVARLYSRFVKSDTQDTAHTEEYSHNPGMVSIGILASRVHAGVLESIGKQIIELTSGRADIIASDVDSSTRAMLIVFPIEFFDHIETLLGREDVARLRLPVELGEGPPDVVLQALRHRMAEIPEELRGIERELSSLSGQWCNRLATIRDVLRDEAEANNVLNLFGETDTTFVLTGWVPAKLLDQVIKELNDTIGEEIVVQPLPLTAELKKKAPIALQNPPPARPFESLVNLLSLPRYGHIDPTRLMAFFLPIFFGMILGDIGYGVLLLGLSLWLLRRFKTRVLHDLLLVLAIGSVWAIVFGLLYGELFGTLGEKLGMHALWIDRASPEDVAALLGMALAVGAVHITLGLVLGVWEAIKARNRSHLLERSGMLVGLIGLFLLVGILARVLPDRFMTPAIAGLIVGIVLLGSSLGWLGIIMGPIEFISLIGNILSYLRIAAIGLASVYLAKVANDIAGMVGNLVVGMIIAILIHSLNLALGAFSPTIHSLRLHYVEFFRKFYEGGGRPYEPYQSRL
ncbi:MAG: V-type ATPase 116kDa subunit family protein [Anaerolineales bacterium]|jgi:V/A-type H+-transporting ATPase subunit I